MENVGRKNATRGKERSRSSRRVTLAGCLLLLVGLAVLAGCATGSQARKEASRADCELVLAMIMEEDYEKAFEFMDEWQNPVTDAAPEPGGSGEAEPASQSTQGNAPTPETAPVKTRTSKQPTAVSPPSGGNDHGTSAKQ